MTQLQDQLTEFQAQVDSIASMFAEIDRTEDDATAAAFGTLLHLMEALAFLLVQVLPQAENTALEIMNEHLDMLHDT